MPNAKGQYKGNIPIKRKLLGLLLYFLRIIKPNKSDEKIISINLKKSPISTIYLISQL